MGKPLIVYNNVPTFRGQNKIVKVLGHHVPALKICLVIEQMCWVTTNVTSISQSIIIKVIQLSHDIVWCSQSKSHCHFIIYKCFYSYCLLHPALHNKCLVIVTKQVELWLVIMRKCKEIDQCPHVISTSVTGDLNHTNPQKQTARMSNLRTTNECV